MSSYLTTNYPQDERGKHDFPHQLCMYLVRTCWGGEHVASGKSVLDIGSGKGSHLVAFQRLGLKPYGVDLRNECVAAARGFDVRECNLEREKLPFPDGYFDFVYTKSVIEHIVNTAHFLSEAHRVLKPGGRAAVMTPDWKSQHETFFDDYTHVRPFTRKGLQNAMRQHGFPDASCRYFIQLPMVWAFPPLRLVTGLLSILPQRYKWKDAQECTHRKLIRFSKEKMLLAEGTKND